MEIYNQKPLSEIRKEDVSRKLKEIERINIEQDDLINISLLATDEIYVMIEPLLDAIPQTVNEGGSSKMVDMYVAMVQRGLKTIEQVPVRYREEVARILKELEK